MTYLQDKKKNQKKIRKIVAIIFVLVFVFYFRSLISKSLSNTTSVIFRPVFILGNKIGHGFSSINIFFNSKKSLLKENEDLKLKLNDDSFAMANYNSILDENMQLKEILSRKKDSTTFILANILAKPNHSIYDTLLIDIGKKNDIKVGNRVFALGDIPIGYIAKVEENSSKVILYTNPGEKTQVVISGKNLYMDIVGRGGGNFEIFLPKDLVLEKGTEIVLPGINTYLIGKVESVISDPRDSLQKALISSPVNIQSLKFVEVER